MSRPRVAGQQSNMVRIFIKDSSKTDGSGLSTLLFSTTGLVIDIFADTAASGGASAYHYKSAATATIQDIGSSGSTCGTYSAPSAANIRFAPVDTTNLPGVYELQILDSLIQYGVRSLKGKVSGPTNCAITWFEIEIADPSQGVRMALSASATTGFTGGASDANFLNCVDVGDIVVVENGSFPGQPRTITAWNKSTGVATVSPNFDNDPGHTTTVVTVYPQAPIPATLPTVNVTQINGGTVPASTATGIPKVEVAYVAGQGPLKTNGAGGQKIGT